jgi:hypothetical protein
MPGRAFGPLKPAPGVRSAPSTAGGRVLLDNLQKLILAPLAALQQRVHIRRLGRIVNLSNCP